MWLFLSSMSAIRLSAGLFLLTLSSKVKLWREMAFSADGKLSTRLTNGIILYHSLGLFQPKPATFAGYQPATTKG
ncbi:hypothetical protein HOY80DRAFT_941414, partial [Tuber brumale]